MKNKLTIMTVVGAVLLGCGTGVQALPIINGAISFDGTAKVNSNNLGTATKFTTIMNSFVDAGTQSGAYAPLTGGEVAIFTPFTFKPTLAPDPLHFLWKVVAAGITYTFTATSVTSVFQTSNPQFLNISGDGFANITGYKQTPGTWTITDTGNKPIFTFGASTVVPDSGPTVAMLGMALGGFALFARKLKTA